MTMKKESRRNISKKTVYFGIVFTAAGFVLLAVLFAMTGKQNSTMSRLRAEREEQQRKLQEAEIQQEGLEELNAYISSSEFLIRYMRETQGYMLDGDIRFDVDDPNAIITTLCRRLRYAGTGGADSRTLKRRNLRIQPAKE